MQIVAKVANFHESEGFAIIEVEAQKVHTYEAIFSLDQELGKNFKPKT
ncbi:hypothetical protein [Brevibacillus laterosporus]|nr:hypothetical protein [Brevibacillus laterosporus]